MRIILLLCLLLISNQILAELLKSSPNLQPQEVVFIQLEALKNNNTPYNHVFS